ncbi:translation initiation factor IF-3 [Candidatus Beckwithbacteria bacterium]|nr:translation initiation factor IF-3 [Candidatus Beckwithbacteria bacterium]
MRYKYNQQKRKFYKVNQYIKAGEVRVITDEGNLGVMPLNEAFKEAEARGLDLVQISEKVEPPICRIIDFTKFQYIEQKKDQSGKKKNKVQEIKELRFNPFIGKGDLDSKIKKIRSFLEDGDKVKLTVKFTGRQITRKDFGNKVLETILAELTDLYKIEQDIKFQGKLMYMIIKPNK